MKKMLGSVLAGCIFVALPTNAAAQSTANTQAVDPAKLTEARGIIAAIFPRGQREQMLTKLQTDIMAQFSPLLPTQLMADPGLKAIFEDFKNSALDRQRAVLKRHFPIQLEAMAHAYSREFSLAELKDVHAFALTPAGSHYLSKGMSIIGDPEVAKANTDMIAEIHAVTQELLPAFKEKAIAYLKAHPEVAQKIKAQGKN